MSGTRPSWRTPACLSVPSLVLLALSGTACHGGGSAHPPPLADDGPLDPPTVPGDDPSLTGEDELPPLPEGWDDLALREVDPAHGPTTGGTEAILRGNGFAGEVHVTFGGRQVDPVDVEIIDSHRVRVLTPPGEVGPALVEVTAGDQNVELEDGFSYDSFFIEPSSGSTGGGLQVEIRGTGTHFDAADVVTFGEQVADAIEIVSETSIFCVVPAHDPGTVDVRVSGANGEWVLEDGFTYFNSADPFGGGLGGGPIQGAIDVTVLDWLTLLPVPEATVLLDRGGDDREEFLTNLDGQVTIAEEGLAGVQTVTVAKAGYGPSSFIDFDARAMTIFLMPIPDPQPGEGGARPDRLASTVNGQLIFYSEVEFGPGPWRIVPDPRDDEEKVSFVFTTKSNVWAQDVDPGEGGVVTEDDAAERGYEYDIIARPGGYAVWAISGLQNTVTHDFVPYAMGVTRNIVTGPGEALEDVDIEMVIPLDEELEVDLVDPPARGALGPNVFGVDAFISLGGEGVIPRYDIVQRAGTGLVTFRLPWMAPFMGPLEDASTVLVGTAATGDDQLQPYSIVVNGGYRSHHDPIALGPFNCVPEFAAPTFGGELPRDRRVEWACNGQEPAFFYMEMWQGITPVWSMFASGSSRSFTLPDVSDITGEEDTPGDVSWTVYAITVPGAGYDTVSYRHLRSAAWGAVAYDVSQFTL